MTSISQKLLRSSFPARTTQQTNRTLPATQPQPSHSDTLEVGGTSGQHATLGELPEGPVLNILEGLKNRDRYQEMKALLALRATNRKLKNEVDSYPRLKWLKKYFISIKRYQNALKTAG